MFTHADTYAIPSDPPSMTVVMIAEREIDRAIVAELVDQSVAARAPTAQLQEEGINGRVMAITLAASLGIGDIKQQLDYTKFPILAELHTQHGIDPEEALRRGFQVRFFAW